MPKKELSDDAKAALAKVSEGSGDPDGEVPAPSEESLDPQEGQEAAAEGDQDVSPDEPEPAAAQFADLHDRVEAHDHRATADEAASDVPPPEEAPAAAEVRESVTFEVRGTKADPRPKTGLVVMRGKRQVAKFVDGKFTTSDPSVIEYLDQLAANHSEGRTRTFDKTLPDGEVVTVTHHDAYAEIREDPTKNNYGVHRVTA